MNTPAAPFEDSKNGRALGNPRKVSGADMLQNVV